ncbi:hypothetical protein ACWFQ6_29820 [Streptomyces althioticus]|uniref:hypothetical protein n=1 Tax=Streptomyces althioticus group TaxID=2867194 RepID=UPI001786A944|nr:hypothetical protein OHA53_13240 [Streptomyces althioticus]GGQ95704.1 hypothetical protein GCM10010267_67880 [Streptomyces griseorubens]
MIYESRDVAATTVARPRLLPWSNLDGNPCYLVTDDTGTGRLSRLADEIEAVQLGMADDLLGHTVDLLGDTRATAPQLRYLAACLAEALHDVHRIARSRGARLHVSDGDEEDADAVPEGGRGN